MNRTPWHTAASSATALALAFSLGACAAANEGNNGPDGNPLLNGTVNGAGSSAQEAAVSAWKAGFQTANPSVTVNYDPAGSGAGREQFIAGGVSFAGSDAYLEGDELTAATERCGGDIIEIPTYVSPIAVVYNLDGIDELNLDPKTIGAIFAGTVKTWDDPAIAATNPDAKLPSSKIVPVHRSDDSGTTKNFTEYLDQASDGGWGEGVVETWPIQSGEAAEGTSGVVAAVKNGSGTIGYADESQAGDLGQVRVKVGDSFTDPTPEAAARSIDTATPVSGRSVTDLAVDLKRDSDAEGVYPIVLVSYQMACQSYDDPATADLVQGWLSYVVSIEGQAAAAATAGSAPLSSDFIAKATAAIDTIKAA